MTKMLGIVPAGGNSTRFGGVMKEILPIKNNSSALSRCINSMIVGGADRVIVSSTEYKKEQHFNALRHNIVDDVYKIIPGKYFGLWDCIADIATNNKADSYLFAMPDTVFPIDLFHKMSICDYPVVMGEFTTNKPERFGVMFKGSIVDKETLPVGNYSAWGTWMFNAEAMEFFVSELYNHMNFTHAINSVISKFNFTNVHIEYYFDFANFKSYKEFLCNRTLKNME